MCDNPAMFRYTWPGEDEAVICEQHAAQLRGIADAMGLHLQIILLTRDELNLGFVCNQTG